VLSILKLLGWRGIVGLVLTATLSVMLVIQKAETRHWHKQSDGYEKNFHEEQDALTQTVANYRAALIQARAEDKANADRVIAQQQATNIERSQSYEARIADLDARLKRVRNAAPGAHPSSPGNPDVSGPVGPAGGADGAPGQDGLSTDDGYICSKQAIQLDELQKWVRSNLQIDRGSSPSAPNASH
jgi:hypothetical protein